MLADIQVSSRFAKALGYSDEQRLLRLPEQGAGRGGDERFAGERKGNHAHVIARSEATKQSRNRSTGLLRPLTRARNDGYRPSVR